MKNALSLIACLIICVTLVQYRVANSSITTGRPLKITEWDAFGYYMYLPAILIYHDVKNLEWVPAIDQKYGLTGGNGVQAEHADNGNYVFKYLGGVAILQLPFFAAAHLIGPHTGYPADGFSPPYQYALGFGILLYSLLAILLLRKILLHYYSDRTTAITLLLVCMGTNYIQYAAVDNGQSHAYIFPLYVLILYATMQWHRKPEMKWAALTGYILGLATISRPTEAIMLFIPLMWNTHTKEAAKAKWAQVRLHKNHLLIAGVCGVAGILPQLIYWKITSGSYLFDVGSKWDFLLPHFRVLLGWEKGWFIYTPVTVFFIAGMFFMKGQPFRKSVLWFCLLNIYIIIAWHDWRYGGSYATRALVQSYPLFALPAAAFVERISVNKWRWVFYTLFLYLICVNLFQTRQYDSTVLHYNDMNRKYYGRIYLNPHPTPADMSLLDNEDFIADEGSYTAQPLLTSDSMRTISADANQRYALTELPLKESTARERWLRTDCSIKAPGNLWMSYVNANLCGDTIKHAGIRLFNAISKDSAVNRYSFYMKLPVNFKAPVLRLYLSSAFPFRGTLYKLSVTELDKTEH